MIALWMAYSLITGILIAGACVLVERVARSTGRPTRGVWMAGMVMMVMIPSVALLPVRSAGGTNAGTPVSTGSEALLPAQSAGSGAGAASWESRISGWFAEAERGAAAAVDHMAGWDFALVALWALMAAFLAGVIAHAAFEGMRLREGLQASEVAGISVLLSDEVGPSAISIGGAAVVIPRWALELDEALVALIVRHEREHLRTRDPFLLLMSLVLVVLVPWHLPLWWGRKRLLLAVEVDCDSRVLRAHPDVRRYGQLLLLAAQRAARPAWANFAVVTVVAPLRPHASHLARRISAMTQPRQSRALLHSVPLVAATLAIAALILGLPTPWRAEAQAADQQARALVRITSVGWEGSLPVSLVIYTTGGAKVGVGLDAPVTLSDTLRLNRVPAITADVTDGEVHIEARGPGTVYLGGEVTGGPAKTLSATGRHLVLLKGGVGIGRQP